MWKQDFKTCIKLKMYPGTYLISEPEPSWLVTVQMDVLSGFHPERLHEGGIIPEEDTEDESDIVKYIYK